MEIDTKVQPKIDGNRITFSVQFSEQRYFIEDLFLEWKDTDAVKVKEGQVKSVTGKLYKFTPSVGKCKRIENYGFLGEFEYPCAELKLRFELI